MGASRFDHVALTYANDKHTDGAGAQLQRIYGIYSLSRFLNLPYAHSPLMRIECQGLSALENNSSSSPELEARYNRTFRIPSDILLPEERTVYEMRFSDAREIEQVRLYSKAVGKFALVRIVYPYPIADRIPDIYRHVRALTPFQRTQADIFRLAIHVRRGDLLAVESGRMLPNSYYVSCALRFVEKLRRLKIRFVCELYTEVATKAFVVTPRHRGIFPGQLAANVVVDPEVNRLDDFNALPNLVRLINLDPIETLRGMATADGLILSRSSYSFVAAILNTNGIVIYHPFWHGPLTEWLISDASGAVGDGDIIPLLERWMRANGR